MTDLLFSPAWWMLLVGAIMAIAMFWVANSRLDAKLRRASGVLIAVVFGWALTAYLVETPTEAALGGSKRFVEAAVARDTTVLRSLLSADASLGQLSRDQIVEIAPKYADEWGLKSLLVTGSDAQPMGSQVVANLRIFSQHEGGRSMGGISTLRSDWQFTWAKSSEGWRIVQITPTKIGETDVTGVISRYFSKPR